MGAAFHLGLVPCRYAMLPMVDMANHKTGVPSEVSYQYFTDEFTLEVGDVPPAGQQLFIQAR